MYFRLVQGRLIALLRRRLQNGELTERGLARRTGISQPHMHNVLKGVKTLSPALADVILRQLDLTLLDLLEPEEIAGRGNHGQSVPKRQPQAAGYAARRRDRATSQ